MSRSHLSGLKHRLDLPIRYAPFTAQAEFGEKAAGQKPVVGQYAVGSERTAHFSGHQAKQIHACDAHVQVEVNLLLASGLAVGEPGVLLGIPDHKLNLVPQAIVECPQ